MGYGDSKRWWRGSPAKLLLVPLGVGGFGVGLILSWRAIAPTPLLITSGVLIVVGLTVDRWSTIRFSHGDTSFDLTARRRVADELESAREWVTQPTIAEGSPGSGKSQAILADFLDRAVEQLTGPPVEAPRKLDLRATHEVAGSSLVLQLTIDDTSPDGLYTCTVHDPNGHASGLNTRLHDPAVSGHQITLRYPEDFARDFRLSLWGTYLVQWGWWAVGHQPSEAGESFSLGSEPPGTTA